MVRAAAASANAGSLMCSSAVDRTGRGRWPASPRHRASKRAASASGSWNGPAGRVDAGDAAARDHHDHRSRATGRASRPSEPAERGVLLGSGPHQRDRLGCGRGTVRPAKPFGDGRPRAEVDHVERADAHDLGNSAPAGGLQPVGPGGEDAADQLVGQLGRRQVEHAGDLAVADQTFHRLAADAGGVEDEHLAPARFEQFASPVDAGGRHAEHRRGDDRPVARRLGPWAVRRPGPSRPGRGRRWRERSGSAIQAGEVGDRVDHHDVAAADVGAASGRWPGC